MMANTEDDHMINATENSATINPLHLKIVLSLDTNLIFPEWLKLFGLLKTIRFGLMLLVACFIAVLAFLPAYLQIRLTSSLLDHTDCTTSQCRESIGQHIKYGKMVALAYDMLQSDTSSVNYLESVLGNDYFNDKLVECVTPGYEYLDDLIAFPANLESTMEGSFFGFIAMNEQTQDLAIVIRGTVTVHDIITDVRFYGSIWDYNYNDNEKSKVDNWLEGLQLVFRSNAPSSNVILHAGFYDIYRTSTKKGRCSLKDQIKGHIDALLKQKKIKTITVTGHSLGAAISTIVALEIAQQIHNIELAVSPEVRLVTFACPLVGNTKLWQKMEELKVSDRHYFNIGDSVPWAQYNWLLSYSHGSPSKRLRLTPAYQDIKPEEQTAVKKYVPFLSSLLSHNLGHILYNIARTAQLENEVDVSVLNKFADYLNPIHYPNHPKNWYNLEKRFLFRNSEEKLQELDVKEDSSKHHPQFKKWANNFIESYATLNGYKCESDLHRIATLTESDNSVRELSMQAYHRCPVITNPIVKLVWNFLDAAFRCM